MPIAEIKIGDKFGRLTVLRIVHPKHRKDPKKVVCTCDCGNEKTVYFYNLLRGASKSCGCLRKEVTRRNATKHGLRNSLYYRLWCSIKNRCYNNLYPSFSYYGGRGITMHTQWFMSFLTFYGDLLSEIGERPTSKHSLDRIDNDKGYCPGNIRWATKALQAYNRRHRAAFKGVSKSKNGYQAEICKEGKRYYLGRFRTQEEAHAAYNKKAAELYHTKPCCSDD